MSNKDSGKAGGSNTPKKGERGFQKSTKGKTAPEASKNKPDSSRASGVQTIIDAEVKKQVMDAKDTVLSGSSILGSANPASNVDVLSIDSESKVENSQEINNQLWLESSVQEIMKNIDSSKKISNKEVRQQVSQAYVVRDRIIKELQDKNTSIFENNKIEFDKFKIKNRAELKVRLDENKGFKKIFKRWGLTNTYDDLIDNYRLSLNREGSVILENEEAIIAKLRDKFNRTLIPKIEKQYNDGKGPIPSSSAFSSRSWHDNSSQTSGSGSGSNGGSGGGSY